MISLTDRAPGQPLYAALYQSIRSEIESGRLHAGDKLPSKRKLAAQLCVSINTVDTAYGQLESEGFIVSRPRSGFFVCSIDLLEKRASAPVAAPAPASKRKEPEIDFAASGAAREKFPLTLWQRLLRSCMEEPDSLRRSPAQGDERLRAEIARYLYDARGVRAAAEQIVVGAGTENLLLQICMLLGRQTAIAVENPVYNQAYLLFSRMGHHVIPADVDRSGVLVGPLQELDHVALYTTPSHQYPLGFSMPMGRRAQLLNWTAGGAFRYLIEDDYDSEFRYDTRPIPALQGIDPNGRVIYLGTFTRSIAPSVRVSFMVLPEELLPRYREKCSVFSCTVSTLEQAVLREFLRQGQFERHVNRMRVYYRQKREALLRALSPLGPLLEEVGEPAGQYLTVRRRGSLTETEMCRRAAENGVRVYPVSPYFLGKVPSAYASTVLLGFSSLSLAEIEAGGAKLVAAWRDE